MNLSDIEVQLENLVRRSCRPLINILSLDHVMDYNLGGEKEYSLLLKSCFFFYKFGIDDRAQHSRLKDYVGTDLPWNNIPENENWIFPGFAEDDNPVLRERSRKLWFKLLDYWFGVFYQNPHFYLKWSEHNGWGWYVRYHIRDIRRLQSSLSMSHSTFVESITEVEMEILKAFGFRSFFQYYNPGTQTSSYWIIFGFWMIANGDEDSPLWFDHLYDTVDRNDPDAVVGYPYRTMVQWYRRATTEVIIITLIDITIVIKGIGRGDCHC